MSPRRLRVVVAAAGALALLTAPAAHAATPVERPNIVVVMTDDQRADDIEVMPKTRRLIGGAGTTFANSYVSYPLCCPSRATFLTGQYSHNHGITWNFEPLGGYELFRSKGQRNTLPRWLQKAGYKTGLIGKYLNEYGEKRPTEIPPGWDDWQASVDPSTYLYYGYTLNVNGQLVRYGTRPEDYMTDVYAQRASRFIERNSDGSDPFFLWVTPNAPHTETETGRAEGRPAVPAPRHAGVFADAPLPRSPNFDEEDMSDKPELLRRFAKVDDGRIGIAGATEHFRGRRGSLLAVDDMVAKLVGTLRRSGELDNTIFLFTSDNGWLLGEHRIVGQKYFGFEESIKVPLMVRGPGFPKGRTARTAAMDVDLAPTFMEAAGGKMGRPADGRPLQDHTRRTADRDMLVETGPNALNLPYYEQLHTRDWVLEEISTGERELYDLRSDPFQLNSLHGQPRYAATEQALHDRLAQLRTCAGRSCQGATAIPEPTG